MSKEECQNLINPEYVCTGCGGKIEPIETVDNLNNPTYWTGCKKCQRFDVGTSKIIFAIARQMVSTHNLIRYPHKDRSDIDWLESQTRGAVSIVSEVIRIYETRSI